MGGLAVLVIVVGALWMTGNLPGIEPMAVAPGEEPSEPAAPAGVCRGLSQVPKVTVTAVDFYNPGSEVDSSAGDTIYREVGTSTWSTLDVSSSNDIQKSAGTVIEIATGIRGTASTNDDEIMYGPLMTYTFPCADTDTLDIPVRQDAAHADLTGVYYDEYDDANTEQAWSAADIKTLGISWTGKYEYDYGNIDCGETSNLLIARYNTTQIDEIEITSIRRTTGAAKDYPIERAAIPVNISGNLSLENMSLMGWYFPVIESNNKYKVTYILDGDDSVPVNTSVAPVSAYGGVIWLLYDSSYYLDNDVNKIKIGWEDEDQSSIGAASRDTITPVIGQTV